MIYLLKSTISNLNVYKLSKEELEAKKKSRISKHQEYFKIHSPESYHPMRFMNVERPCSAPPSRVKPLVSTPTKEPSAKQTPKTVPTTLKSKNSSKTSKISSNTTLPSFNMDLNNTQFLNLSKFKQEFPQLDLLPLTSRILQQENSETSSESDKDKSLTNGADIFQEDDFHRFGEWSSNMHGTYDEGPAFEAASRNRETELDFIKNELLDLRSNVLFKKESESKAIENLLEEKTRRESELEEKASYLQHELDISRKSYEDLDRRFSQYRKENEERTISLLQRIDELEKALKNSQNREDEPYVSHCQEQKEDPATDYVINGRSVLKSIEDTVIFTPKKNQTTPPQPVMQLDTKPVLRKSSPKDQSPAHNHFLDENKENIEIVKNGDECSPFSTYRYPVQFTDNAIEIHRPLIIGRDFSSTLQSNQLPSKQNKDFSPPSSFGNNSLQHSMLSNKVKKFNIREKH